jgi:hypothetical protein
MLENGLKTKINNSKNYKISIQKKYQIIIFTLSLVLLNSVVFSQEKKNSVFRPYKIGILFNQGNEKNLIFDDDDYFYKTQTYKLQTFHRLGKYKKFNFELIVQPQLQFAQHQLLNIQYVTPDQDNFEAKREEFIAFKTMNLYGVEFGLSVKKNIAKNLEVNFTTSLGFMYINKRSERLAEGFTFIENFSLGGTYLLNKKLSIYLGTNFGHVSNLNFLSPNDGYNILGFEVGFQYQLN